MIRRYLLNPIRGITTSILYLINMVLTGLFVLITALVVSILPSRQWRHRGKGFLLELPRYWMLINRIIMMLSTYGKWDIQSTDTLSRNNWYLLVSNHQSWFDILVLGYVFNKKIPAIKFFMKKELLWALPVGGIVCYVLGYPFLHRHTGSEIRKNPELKGKDIEVAQKACEKFKLYPTTIMNFAEGTRFSDTKRQNTRSPYQYLLKPKAGAIAIVAKEMQSHLTGVINATIAYKAKQFGFWQLACGNVDKISVHYELLSLSQDLIGDYYSDRAFRIHFQNWLNGLWEEKDQQIRHIKHND